MKTERKIKKICDEMEMPERSAVYPPGVSSENKERAGVRFRLDLVASAVVLVVMVFAVVIGQGLIRKDYVEPGVTGENSGTADDTMVIDVPKQGDGDDAELAYEPNVAYANWTDSEKLLSCLNADKLALDSEPHVPVFRFDTKGDLDKFREIFGDVLTFTYGYDEVPSFDEATAKYDDGFFAGHTVVLAYVGAVSGSYRFGIGDISVNGSKLCLHIDDLRKDLQEETCDLAGWLVMAEFADADIAGITDFDAIMEYRTTGSEDPETTEGEVDPAGFGWTGQNNRTCMWWVSPEYMAGGDAYCRLVIFNHEGNKRIYSTPSMRYVYNSAEKKDDNNEWTFSEEELAGIIEKNEGYPDAKIAVEISRDESFVDSWISESVSADMLWTYWQEQQAEKEKEYDEANLIMHATPYMESFHPVGISWVINNSPFVVYRVVFYHYDPDTQTESEVYISKETGEFSITIDDFDYDSLWRDDIDIRLNEISFEIQGRKEGSPDGDWYSTRKCNFFPPEWLERKHAAYPEIYGDGKEDPETASIGLYRIYDGHEDDYAWKYYWEIPQAILSQGEVYGRCLIIDEDGQTIYTTQVEKYIEFDDFDARFPYPIRNPNTSENPNSFIFTIEEIEEISERCVKDPKNLKIAVEISHGQSFEQSRISEEQLTGMVVLYREVYLLNHRSQTADRPVNE